MLYTHTHPHVMQHPLPPPRRRRRRPLSLQPSQPANHPQDHGPRGLQGRGAVGLLPRLPQNLTRDPPFCAARASSSSELNLSTIHNPHPDRPSDLEP
eukprot:2058184-Rhodomonas_salina.2